MQSYWIQDWKDLISCAKAELEIIEILKHAESICQNVFFIPGNHDPPNLFWNSNIDTPSLISDHSNTRDDKTQLRENWYNLHGNIVNIGKGLKLVGYEGSKDNLLEKDGEIIGTHWEAFPYADEEDFSAGLMSMFAKLTQENSADNPFQFILITHIGPYSSSQLLILKQEQILEKIFIVDQKH